MVDLSCYLKVIDAYLCGEMSARDLQSSFIAEFKNEQRRFGPPIFEILDSIFGWLDSFTEDQELLEARPDFFLSEADLRAKLQAARADLLAYRP